MLARMFDKRRRGYRSLGYGEGDPPHDFELLTDPAVDGDDEWPNPRRERPRRK